MDAPGLPAPPAPAGDGAKNAAAEALEVAMGDAELGAALAGDWKKLVIERKPDGRVAIDVDGVGADIDLGGASAPAEGDGAPPMPPPPAG